MAEKKVLVTQLSEEQQKLWQSLLLSQGIKVTSASANSDLVLALEQMPKESLPNLLLIDIGMTTANSTSLQARAICRWCADNHPDIKVILTNPREDQVKNVGLRWATRQGAVDLLPRLHSQTLVESMSKVLSALGSSPQIASLEKFAESLGASEIAQPTKSQASEIREVATADLVRKMAMIPLIVMAGSADEPTDGNASNISLASTLDELSLYDFEIDIDSLGINAGNAFRDNPLLPGVILTEQNIYTGMISRQRFLDYMSRPYSLELFSKRPLRILYETAQTEILVLDGKNLIVSSAQETLRRPVNLIYEPIVVLCDSKYKLLDVHDLFVAQSQIHELATKLIREQTQDRMVQTEKMATLGEIVSDISRDLGKPVESIFSNLNYLSDYSQSLIDLLKSYEQELPNSPQIAELRDAINVDFILEDLPKIVSSISAGTSQLQNIVSGLQTFSAVEETMATDVDINKCVENSLAILGSRLANNVTIVKNYGSFAPFTGFPSQLVQVFMNLIGNAIDALAESENASLDSKLESKLESKVAPKIEITTAANHLDGKDWIVIKIADNGSGIPSELQPKIFENFFASKDSGKSSGLGLAISHQIVTQNHRGRISLLSPCLVSAQGNHGTEFQILLPQKNH